MFATKKSLICQLTEERDPKRWAEMGFKKGEVTDGRVWIWTYNFVLPTVEQVTELKKARLKQSQV